MPGGMAAAYHTLRMMRRLVTDAKTDPRVIQSATNIIFNTPEKDDLAEASALFDYVRDYIRYTKDVNGVEVISPPWTVLQRMVGDCDDKATLLAALFEVAGLPTRFVIAGYTVPGLFEHVYLQVYILGHWIDADPTESGNLGYAPPNPVALDFER
jgi:transglutaminase-like putative cysteine protease